MVEDQAGRDPSRTGQFRNEVEGLRSLNSATSGSVSWVNFAVTPSYPTGGGSVGSQAVVSC